MLFNKYGYYLYSFLIKKWYFDKFYNNILISYFLTFGYEVSYNLLDKGFYEYFGPMGLVNLFFKLTDKINKIQSGQINFYIYFIFWSIVILSIILII